MKGAPKSKSKPKPMPRLKADDRRKASTMKPTPPKPA